MVCNVVCFIFMFSFVRKRVILTNLEVKTYKIYEYSKINCLFNQTNVKIVNGYIGIEQSDRS